MIDINLCDLSNFFGCVQATNTPELKTNAFRPLRTYLQEKSFEKWSGNQLRYVGDHEDGKDFYDTNGVPYEMKGSLGLFNKNGSCKRVVLINKRPGQKKNNELKRRKGLEIKKGWSYKSSNTLSIFNRKSSQSIFFHSSSNDIAKLSALSYSLSFITFRIQIKNI